MSKSIVCDLTELTTVSGGRLRYYGIARTVAEIAKVFVVKNRDVKFVVYSADFQEFFEVKPKLDGGNYAGVDLNTPDFEVFKFRRVFHSKGPEERLANLLGPAVSFFNRQKIKRPGYPLIPVDLNGSILFSAARPKLMIDMIRTIKSRSLDVSFRPLIHDLIPLHDLGGHSVQSFAINFFHDSKYVIENSDQIITNSHFTMDDIVRFANGHRFTLPNRIVPVPLVHECPAGSEQAIIEVPAGPYFLAVGTLMGRKNLNVILDCLVLMAKSRNNMPKLIIAGAFRKHIARALVSDKYASIARFVEQIDNPNQTDLVRLYRGATALIMPSRIEGWGLPAGEALWLGTAAICSTAEVLKEVCGDLGLYFDPDEPGELMAHMEKLMDDDGFREKLSEKISNARPTLRTWEHVAGDIYGVLSQSFLRFE